MVMSKHPLLQTMILFFRINKFAFGTYMCAFIPKASFALLPFGSIWSTWDNYDPANLDIGNNMSCKV